MASQSLRTATPEWVCDWARLALRCSGSSPEGSTMKSKGNTERAWGSVAKLDAVKTLALMEGRGPR